MSGIPDIPWHGPVPLRPGSGLAGRAGELRELLDARRTYDVIVLTAWSGVGKTSFVDAAVIPTLQRDGRRFVPTPVRWQDALDAAGLRSGAVSDPRAGAERLYRVVIESDPGSTKPIDEVLADQARGRPPIIVLDQFEELLRYHAQLAEELLRVAGQTARDVGVPHVVIARAEYRERLRPVEVPSAAVWSMSLSELSEQSLPSVIRGPAKVAKVEVTEDAVNLLVGWWTKARSVVGKRQLQGVVTEAIADVGLLHFQSLLWSFKHWAVARGETGHLIDERMVGEYATARTNEKAYTEPTPAWVFQDALVQYVRNQADKLGDAAGKHQQDGAAPTWRNGPRLLLARVAPALTAAGFKQPQTVHSLIPHALGDELTPRRASQFAESLQHGGSETESSLLKGFRDSGPSKRDGVQPAGIASANGWDGAKVVAEMLSALREALRHMSEPEINILRAYGRTGESIYELVHDGMGAALKEWAKAFLEQPVATIGVIAEQPGRAVVGAKLGPAMLVAPGAGAAELWGAVGPWKRPRRKEAMIAISRLGWPGSAIIDTTFEDICLNRCNLRGASFIGCTFKNVVFKDCDLVATLLLDCRLQDVTFDGAKSDELERPVDLLTIKNPSDSSSVTFDHLPTTTGLFLVGLTGGKWSIRDSTVRHLVVEATKAVTIHLYDTHAYAVSRPDVVSFVPHGRTTLSETTLDQ